MRFIRVCAEPIGNKNAGRVSQPLYAADCQILLPNLRRNLFVGWVGSHKRQTPTFPKLTSTGDKRGGARVEDISCPLCNTTARPRFTRDLGLCLPFGTAPRGERSAR